MRQPGLAAGRTASAPLALTGLRVQAGRARLWWRARRRARLAAGYERVVACAERAVSRRSAVVPVRQAAVRSARVELLAVAALLRSRRSLAPAGLAAARQLVCDGNGPLYVEGDLRAAVRRVLDLLEGGQRAI